MNKANTAALLSGLLFLSACATTTPPTPQIEVSPEAAARMCIIHACGRPPEDLGTAPSPRGDGPAFARAVEGAASDGPDVDLGNPEILVRLRARAGSPLEILSLGDAVVTIVPHVIDGPPRPASQAIASRLTGPRTALSVLALADGSPRDLLTDRVSMFASEDGSATVTVFGHASASPLLRTTTTLKLARGDRAVLVSTTLENTGSAPADALDVDDHVSWDGMRAFVPGATYELDGPGLHGAREFKGPYVGAIGGNDSLAFTSTDGEVSATLEKDDARLHLAHALVLAPRSQRTFDRVIVVGTRADSSSVVAELVRASGLPTGVVRVNLYGPREVDGERPPAVSATVPQELIIHAGTADALTVLMPNHAYDVELPEGSFTIRSKGQPESAGVPVTIHAGLVANISVPLAR